MAQSKCGLKLMARPDGSVEVGWEYQDYDKSPPYNLQLNVNTTSLPYLVAEELLGVDHPVIKDARARREMRRQALLASLSKQIENVKQAF